MNPQRMRRARVWVLAMVSIYAVAASAQVMSPQPVRHIHSSKYSSEVSSEHGFESGSEHISDHGSGHTSVHGSEHSSVHASEHSFRPLSATANPQKIVVGSAEGLPRPAAVSDFRPGFSSNPDRALNAPSRSSTLKSSALESSALKSPAEFSRPGSFKLLASFIAPSARFEADHVVPDRELGTGSAWSAFAPTRPAPAHNVSDRLNDPEFYAHHLPGVGPIIEKMIQTSKAHPRLTHAFEVIQPDFF